MYDPNTWINTDVILIHAMKHVSHDSDAIAILRRAKYELNVAMAGGKEFYPFAESDE